MRFKGTIIFVLLFNTIASINHGFPPYNDTDLFPQRCYNNQKDCRVYTFSFFSVDDILFNFNGNTTQGYYVELVKLVCKLANKRCKVGLIEFERCWMETGVSEALDNRVYDTCALAFTQRRAASYEYAQIPLNKGPQVIGVVKSNSPLQESNFTQENNLTLAFSSDPNSVISGALPIFNRDYFINETVGVNSGSIKEDVSILVNKVISGSVDIALVWDATEVISNSELRQIFTLDFQLGGLFLTVRKDELDLLYWWDKHYLELLCTKEGESYKDFCDVIKDNFEVSNLTCFVEEERKRICDLYSKKNNK